MPFDRSVASRLPGEMEKALIGFVSRVSQQQMMHFNKTVSCQRMVGQTPQCSWGNECHLISIVALACKPIQGGSFQKADCEQQEMSYERATSLLPRTAPNASFHGNNREKTTVGLCPEQARALGVSPSAVITSNIRCRNSLSTDDQVGQYHTSLGW